VIERVIASVAEEGGKNIVDDFNERTVLLESGLDSLDFAIVVARLEQELQTDPFSKLSEPVYPRTFQDLVDVYEQDFQNAK